MASPTTPPKPCYLFTIPIELRLVIYEDVPASFTIPHDSGHLSITPLTRYLVPLLNTCTQIRAEAAKSYRIRMQRILDGALKDLTDLMAEYVEAGAPHHPSSVKYFQNVDRVKKELREAEVHYKRVVTVVGGESVLATGEMEGGSRMQKGEEMVRDAFGDWYGVSEIRETYGR